MPGYPAGASFKYAFDCGMGTFGLVRLRASTTCATASTAPDGTTLTVRGKVIDQDGNATEYSDTVTLTAAP